MDLPVPYPKLSNVIGYDTCGRIRRLGERDSDGYLVGWISPDGLCSESREAAEAARAAGLDAEHPEVSAADIVRASCAPENRFGALVEIHSQRSFKAQIMRLAKAGLITEGFFRGDFEMPSGVTRQAAFGG